MIVLAIGEVGDAWTAHVLPALINIRARGILDRSKRRNRFLVDLTGEE